jgi:hypothetical protein
MVMSMMWFREQRTAMGIVLIRLCSGADFFFDHAEYAESREHGDGVVAGRHARAGMESRPYRFTVIVF